MKARFTAGQVVAMLSGLMPLPLGVSRDQLTSMPTFSRGKGGKSSTGNTGAAKFKREAKKRNNIRKRK